MTVLSSLTIVPAGAGSGKTHYIQETLTRWIQEHKIAPEKIVAVTFTEAAASELRGRIRASMVKAGLLDEANRLDQAYISTIHGFGLRLITEFAFDGGISPTPRLLNDDEKDFLIGHALARSTAAGTIMSNLERFGYRGSFGSNNTSIEDAFRGLLSGFVATLRSIGKETGAGTLRSGVERQISLLYGPAQLADHLKKNLLHAIATLLESFPVDISSRCKVSENIRQQLKSNFVDLKRAEKGISLDTDWRLWKRLGTLKTYKKNSKLPSGYDDLANEVIAAALELSKHPGPLADALEHANLLLSAAIQSLQNYHDDKQGRGLLDFTDMLASARQLLISSPTTMTALREQVDCLVVDEFQDTNPLQFSLLWSLTRQGVPTIIVGDLKQAIMGFQNADARLLNALCVQNTASTSHLTGNWRSSPELMRWINTMGKGLFGATYTALTPRASFVSQLSSLEVIDVAASTTKDVVASHVAGRIHALLHDDNQHVHDKSIGTSRRLRGGDIAIICPTNSRLQYYATRLRRIGIPCRLQETGWSLSPIVTLAIYALSYVADPDDLHAALYLAVTELGSHALETALAEFVAGRPLHDPQTLDRLDCLAEQAVDRTTSEVLSAVIAALHLYDIIAIWPDADQARANLLRLQEECLAFETANRETLACGGYYGTGVKSFLAWLQGKSEWDDSQPAPSVLDEHAVQLTTWHSSKGKEWPIVLVCGLDDNYAPRLPTTRVVYEDFNDLAAILDKVRVEIFPDFDSAVTKRNFLDELAQEAEESALRLLYVALTRAREKLILEWPSHQGSKELKQTSYWQLFAGKTSASLTGTTMIMNGVSFPCRVQEIDKEPWEIDSPVETGLLSPLGRRAIVSKPMPESLTPEHRTPSSLHGQQEKFPPSKHLRYADSIEVMQEIPALERGLMLHRCFEILLQRPEAVDQLGMVLGNTAPYEDYAAVAATVESLRRYLQTKFAAYSVKHEEPFICFDDQGTVVTGTIDMLIETSDGFWIIDHKSDRVDESEISAMTEWYYPQLKTYSDAVTAINPDKTVKGIMINWIGLGMLTEI
jgi:ATP-dependent exoDNAse (exonuclease V) beta subunit